MAKTVILGASTNPSRYSNKAQKLLIDNGHEVILVSPKGGVIDGIPCLKDLTEVSEEIDTVTVYVGPAILESLVEKIIELKPRRVILNPGTESLTATQMLKKNQIEVEEACTLVLLSLGSY